MICSRHVVIDFNPIIDQWILDCTAIYNEALFYLRNSYFSSKLNDNSKPVFKVYHTVKLEDCFTSSKMDYQTKVQAVRLAESMWSTFWKTVNAYLKDKLKFTGKPKMPFYLKNGRTCAVIIDSSRLRGIDTINNTIKLPKSDIVVQIPYDIEISSIKCIRIARYYGKHRLEIQYEKPEYNLNLSNDNVMGIDLGVANTMSITTNNHIGKSWIVKGGLVKSINQWYNKKVSELESKLPTGRYTSHEIERLTMKHNHQIDYWFNRITNNVIQLCIDNNIERIIVGHNTGWKQCSGIGKRNNQNFVSIPFNKLIQKLKYKAELVGITFEETEESYTSKCDHLAYEPMCHHSEYLGDRTHRGLFVSSTGKQINADINGAIGIIRKVLGDSFIDGLSNRGDIVSSVVLHW